MLSRCYVSEISVYISKILWSKREDVGFNEMLIVSTQY